MADKQEPTRQDADIEDVAEQPETDGQADQAPPEGNGAPATMRTQLPDAPEDPAPETEPVAETTATEPAETADAAEASVEPEPAAEESAEPAPAAEA